MARTSILFLTIVTAILFGTNALLAEPVMLRGAEIGQGYTFSQNGNCYVVFPEHVAGGRGAEDCNLANARPGRRLQVIAEGALTGTASPRFPFWCGLDLAVAQVMRDATRACTTTLDDLTPPRRAPNASGRGVLLNVDEEGLLTRWEMRVTTEDYLTFEAAFSGSSEMSAMQGMSGGFFLMNEKPVGMALTTTDTGGVRFMRIEEIHMNLSRWLGTQSAVLFGRGLEDGPGAGAGADTPGALPLEILSVSATATGPDTMADNMLLDEGAYVFTPNRTNTIDLSVGAPSEKTTVSRVRLFTDPDAGKAVPRGLVVLVNSAETGGRWRSFQAGEMTPTGVFDTGPIAETYAKRVRIRVTSAWSSGPVRIDRVVIE